MALLVISRGIEPAPFAELLRRLPPRLDVRLWPETGDKAEIRYALAWRPPPGELATCPNLEVIFSIGAGVDHLMGDPGLSDVPIVRFVDPDLTTRMREYVLLHAMLHQRRTLELIGAQRERQWNELDQPLAGEVRAGVMGLGVLGAECASALAHAGFVVAGWSRTPKTLAGIEVFSGAGALDAFLARTDILVCLLPLTPETRGMLDRRLFAKLARDGALPGPALINAGRGGLQVEADILAALGSGDLWSCSLDVFEEEPLPATSPLWAHPRVLVTAHTASVSQPRLVCRHVLRQIARHRSGEPLENVVERARGY